MKVIICTIAILLSLLLTRDSHAANTQTVTGSFRCDVEFVRGGIETSNCEVFDVEFE